jgi:hypothetical protein
MAIWEDDRMGVASALSSPPIGKVAELGRQADDERSPVHSIAAFKVL